MYYVPTCNRPTQSSVEAKFHQPYHPFRQLPHWLRFTFISDSLAFQNLIERCLFTGAYGEISNRKRPSDLS